MAILQRFPKLSLSISKIATILLVTAVVAFVLARFAVPCLISASPLLWSSIRFVLSPPYLFITVHVIIVAIWMLSDQNHNGKPPHSSVYEVDRNATPSKTVSVESDPVTPGSDSKSAESCVTNESEENSAVSSRFELEDEEVETEDTWREVVMKKSATWEVLSDVEAVEADVTAEIAGERVVRKSATMKDSTAEGNDELNRRFEAFIKKNYDQIRSY